jgi:hypothetical protein
MQWRWAQKSLNFCANSFRNLARLAFAPSLGVEVRPIDPDDTDAIKA